ncbi:MAG: hypothetical protein LBK06_10580 [Planctomycetaceae bacterium]|jgi:hypothetical protein|nr:hypothetical protein [Planctomycetaceae bacterium]
MKKINYVTIVVLFTTFIMFGCSSGQRYQTTNLDGVVTIDGKAVNDGMMSFSHTAGGGTGVRANIVAGKYAAKKVPVGNVNVTFTAVEKTGKKVQAMGVEVDEQVSIIPPKYKEGITIEIVSGQKKHDFILTSTTDENYVSPPGSE